MADLKKLLDQLEQALPELQKAVGMEEDSESPDEEAAEGDDEDMPPTDDGSGDEGDDMGMPMPLKKKKAPLF